MLKGYRTYILAFIGILANGAYALGYIPTDMIPVVNALLVFLGMGTLRAGMK